MKLKKIADVKNAKYVSEIDKTLRLNVMRSLGSKLQELNRQFRRMQKEFMSSLKGQTEIGAKFYGLDEDLDRNSNVPVEMMALKTNDNAYYADRSQDIQRIIKSINELAELFNELSVLVVEQGTILDRIDYNVEQTVVHTKQGLGELRNV